MTLMNIGTIQLYNHNVVESKDFVTRNNIIKYWELSIGMLRVEWCQCQS